MKRLRQFVMDHADKIVLGAAAAWLLSYVTLSVLLAESPPGIREVGRLKECLEKSLTEKEGDLPPFVAPDKILEKLNVPPAVIRAVTWAFQIQPVVKIAEKRPETVHVNTVISTVLPAPVLDTLLAGLDGVKITWKPGDVPADRQASPIRGYYVERKGPKDGTFIRLNKDALPPDQTQFHDAWSGQQLSMADYQYRVVAYTDDRLSTAASQGGHVPGEAKKVTTSRSFDIKVLFAANDSAKIRIERYIPALNNFVTADFSVLKGYFIGHPEGKNEHQPVIGYLKDSSTAAMNPETKKPEWDFYTGYQVKQIQLDAKFNPPYHVCNRTWDNTLQEFRCQGLQKKNDLIKTANTITVSYLIQGKEVTETLYDRKIEIDDRNLRCEDHGGTLKKKPGAPKNEDVKHDTSQPPQKDEKKKDEKKKDEKKDEKKPK